MLKTVATIALALLAAALIAACSSLGTLGALLGDEVSFDQPRLQNSLDRKFPRQYDKLGGLVSLTVMNPRLSIPRDSQRLRLDFDVGLGALGRDSAGSDGHFAVTSAVRYSPQTRGLHLDHPSIEQVDVPGMGGLMDAGSRQLLDTWLQDYARDEPIYTLDNSLLDRLGARRIRSATVENGEIVVHLGE